MLELGINGRALHPSLPRGESACALHLAGRFLVARLPSGETLKVDLRRAELHLGGPDGKEFIYASREPEGPTFITSDGGLHQSAMAAWHSDHAKAASPGGPSGRQARHARRARLSRSQLVVLAVAAAVVGSLLGAMLLVGPLARVALRFVPRSVDRDIGGQAYSQVIRLIGTVREDAALHEPVQAVLDRLVDAVPDSPFQFRVAICDSPLLNAFALPGGQIVVTTRMLAALDSAEELAAVLAHEMNHVLARHSMEMTIRASGLRFLIHVASGRKLAASMAMSVWSAVGVMGYSRQKESDADRLAVHLLADAHVDPRALLPMFAKLRAEEERHEGRHEGDGDGDGDGDGAAQEKSTKKLLEKFRSHPAIAQRMADVEAEIATLPALSPEPLGVDFAALGEAVRRLETPTRRSPLPGR